MWKRSIFGDGSTPFLHSVWVVIMKGWKVILSFPGLYFFYLGCFIIYFRRLFFIELRVARAFPILCSFPFWSSAFHVFLFFHFSFDEDIDLRNYWVNHFDSHLLLFILSQFSLSTILLFKQRLYFQRLFNSFAYHSLFFSSWKSHLNENRDGGRK